MVVPNNSSEDQNSFLGDCYSESGTRDGTSSPKAGTERQSDAALGSGTGAQPPASRSRDVITVYRRK